MSNQLSITQHANILFAHEQGDSYQTATNKVRCGKSTIYYLKPVRKYWDNQPWQMLWLAKNLQQKIPRIAQETHHKGQEMLFQP